MGTQVEGQWVVPNPQVPRTFGMLNIVFGVVLFLFGAGSLAMTYFAPLLQKWAFGFAESQQASQKARRGADRRIEKRRSGSQDPG